MSSPQATTESKPESPPVAGNEEPGSVIDTVVETQVGRGWKDAFRGKDFFDWYFGPNKAHINVTDGFWGDDAISQAFKSFSDNVTIPAWNTAMKYDIVRLLVLILPVGFIGWRLGQAREKKKAAPEKEAQKPES